MDRERRGPRVFSWILRLLVPEEFSDEIEGDLYESYQSRLESGGTWRAGHWFVGQLLRMRPWQLRRAARVRGRNQGLMSEAPARRSGWTSNGWSGEVRQAFRSLRTRTAFSITIVITVAIAVGATTTVFSVVNGVLLRPLDFPDPERLVLAWQTNPEWDDHPNAQLRAFAQRFPLSVPTFNDWQEARTSIESMGIYTGDQWVHQTGDGAQIYRGHLVTSGVFDALGVEAARGRHLIPEDDQVGSPQVAVLSDRLWRNEFGAQPSVVGEVISLDGIAHTVVGVMPTGFQIPGTSGDLWTSFTEEEKLSERDSQSYTVLGRIATKSTVKAAQADLNAIQARLAETYEDQGDRGARVQGVLEAVVGEVRSTLLFLFAAVGLVLLIACVNIANMLSVNSLTRNRELSVRAALGADRIRLVRGLLTESGFLALGGGLLGTALTFATLPLIVGVLPSSLPRTDTITADWRVLSFGVFITATTSLLVGILPAFQAARANPKAMMDATSRGLGGGTRGEHVRTGLVITEVALAFVLLVGATLLATSYNRLWNVDRGFSSEGLVTMSVEPNPTDFPEAEDRRLFRDELLRRLEAIPGTRVSVANQVPLAGSTSSTTYYFDRPQGPPEEGTVMISVVDHNYFDVMRIRVIEGRPLSRSDVRDSPLVGVVNSTLARQYWPGESALGKYLRADEDAPPTMIVGITGDVRHQGLDIPAAPKLYVPSAQNHREPSYWLLRVQGDPAAAMDLAKQALAQVSPSTPIRNIQLLDERISRDMAVTRFRTAFVVSLAILATILALLGVYGVVMFAVSQRTRELAVRMAIGAHPRDVVAGTMVRGGKVCLAGVVVGGFIAWQVTQLLDEFLFEISPSNPLTYIAAAVLIGGVSVVASYLPARRASRVDPMTVLKAE